MKNSNFRVATLAATLLIFNLPLASSQLVQILPTCVKTCINQSGSDNCQVSDTKCLCRASNGNFLPDLITCIHWGCDNNMDANLLLTGLQFVCSQVGAPVATAAILNAEQEAGNLATLSPATVTVTESAGSTANSAIAQFTTLSTASTSTTVNSTGSTYIVVYPQTYTRIIYIATASTVIAPVHTVTNVIPVIVVGTDSTGSVYTLTTKGSGFVRTITTTYPAGNVQTVISTQGASSIASVWTVATTNSAGSTYTTTQRPSSSNTGGAGATGSGGSSSSSTDSISESTTTTLTTRVAAQSTTGSLSSNVPGASTIDKSANPEVTDSSPFAVQSAAVERQIARTWLGLAVLLIAIGTWI